LIRPGISTQQLAEVLTPFAKRSVVDETKLQGTFDVDLTISPEVVMVTQDSTTVTQPIEGLSVVTAVREQLGLRLRSVERPTPIILVESAHAPGPD
jgi:uncharacterized protein (TIGR03435 family)